MIVITTRLSPGPRDGDHALGLRGNGLESGDGQVERVAVGASGADVPDLGGDALAVVVVGDSDGSATVLGSSTEVGSPDLVVDGDTETAVLVPVTASTGVAVLVEVGSEAAGVLVTGRSGSLSGLRGGLGGPGGGGGRSLGRSDGDGGVGGDGVGVLGLSLEVGRLGLDDGGGRGGAGSRLGGRGRLGRVRDAVRESGLLEGLGSEHGGAAVREELGALLAGTSDGDVSGVVCGVSTRRDDLGLGW